MATAATAENVWAPKPPEHAAPLAPQAPDELGITVVLRLAPPMPFLPPDQYQKPVLGLILVSGVLSEVAMRGLELAAIEPEEIHAGQAVAEPALPCVRQPVRDAWCGGLPT